MTTFQNSSARGRRLVPGTCFSCPRTLQADLGRWDAGTFFFFLIFIFHLHQTRPIRCSPYHRFIMNSKSEITFQSLMLIPCPWVQDVTAVMEMLSNRTPHSARDNYFKSTLLTVVHMLTLCFQLIYCMFLTILIAADQHALSVRLYSVDLQKIWYNFLQNAYHPSPGVLITLCNNQKLSNYGISKLTINIHHRGFAEIWF